GELYDNLLAHRKIAFVNMDNPHLVEMVHQREPLHIVPYGLKNNCVEIVENDPGNPFLKMTMPNPCLMSEPSRIEVNTNLIGRYNADNVLAALCISSYFDVPTADAVAAIAGYVPSNNRSQMTKTEKNILIIDAYNANPTSMRASVGNFDTLNFEGKVLVLGDMRELGEDSLKEHTEFVEYLSGVDVEKIYLVGEEFKKAVGALKEKTADCASDCASDSAVLAQISLFDDSALLREHLVSEPLEGKTVLIKGSRGIKLERIFDVL
ncbi:MAG: UDP-N-acetylmuramoyl-tripeptide--D-alanyl-D-alanine ligase, partial [Bacteroidales bacterium]|nr:UDP-N-acetylmuramoyl-tripeptide--D-alanyl-D-alanine ligase [Bacteroidales bacterium]